MKSVGLLSSANFFLTSFIWIGLIWILNHLIWIPYDCITIEWVIIGLNWTAFFKKTFVVIWRYHLMQLNYSKTILLSSYLIWLVDNTCIITSVKHPHSLFHSLIIFFIRRSDTSMHPIIWSLYYSYNKLLLVKGHTRSTLVLARLLYGVLLLLKSGFFLQIAAFFSTPLTIWWHFLHIYNSECILLPVVTSQSATLRCLCMCCVCDHVFVAESAGCSITPAQLVDVDRGWFTEYPLTHIPTQAYTCFVSQKCFIKVLPEELLGLDTLTSHRPRLNYHNGWEQRKEEKGQQRGTEMIHSKGSTLPLFLFISSGPL